ncbi:class I SAM-dependent methyltransferase [Kineococcus terrestris]|uniref:class I SAM-dependent methyltransferase n=1 Tax=Kineococcus terrestris TaxID=2044856 RepID=UPI0034DB675E
MTGTAHDVSGPVAALVRAAGPDLGPAPWRVLDAGGGEGRDAVVLAALGHEVTVLDRLPAALEQARTAAALAGVADRVRTVAADLDDLAALAALTRHRAGGSGSFDVVCCHDVLHQRGSVARAEADVAALTSSLRPGGHLSLTVPPPPGSSGPSGSPGGPGSSGSHLHLAADLLAAAVVAAGGAVVHRAVDGDGNLHLVGRRR